jgi:hypothetical protein
MTMMTTLTSLTSRVKTQWRDQKDRWRILLDYSALGKLSIFQLHLIYIATAIALLVYCAIIYGRPKNCSILLTIWSSLTIAYIRIPFSRRPLLFSGILLHMGIASMTFFSIGINGRYSTLLKIETNITGLCGTGVLIGFPNYRLVPYHKPSGFDWAAYYLRRHCLDIAIAWWLNFILR